MPDTPEPVAADGELHDPTDLPIKTTHHWTYYTHRFQWVCVPVGHGWNHAAAVEDLPMPEPGECDGCFRSVTKEVLRDMGFLKPLSGAQMVVLDSIARAQDLARQEASS